MKQNVDVLGSWRRMTIVFADSWLASHESVLLECCLSVCRLSSVCYIRGLWPNGAR